MGFGRNNIEQPTTLVYQLEKFVRDSLPDVGPAGIRPCVFQSFRDMLKEPETLPGLDYRRLDSALSKMEESMSEMVESQKDKLDRVSDIKFRLNQAGVPVVEKDALELEKVSLTRELDDLRVAISQLSDRYNSRIQGAFGDNTTKPQKDTFLNMVEGIVKKLRKEWKIADIGEVLEFKADFQQDDPALSYVVRVIRRNVTKHYTGKKRAFSNWRNLAEKDEEFYAKTEENGPTGASVISSVKD